MNGSGGGYLPVHVMCWHTFRDNPEPMPGRGELGIHLSSHLDSKTEAAAKGLGRLEDFGIRTLTPALPPPHRAPGTYPHTEWNCRSVARWGHRGNCFLMPVQLGGSNWEGAWTRASPPGCCLAEADSGRGPFCQGMEEPHRSCHPGP